MSKFVSSIVASCKLKPTQKHINLQACIQLSFGIYGARPGQFKKPHGITVDTNGTVQNSTN